MAEELKPPTIAWELPDGWVDVEPPLPVLAAATPAEPGPDPFGVNVQVVALRADSSGLLELRASILRKYATHLDAGRLLDVAPAELDGNEAFRVLAAYVGERGDELTVEQWITLENGFQVVLTATAPSLDYHWHLEAFGEIAESVEFDV